MKKHENLIKGTISALIFFVVVYFVFSYALNIAENQRPKSEISVTTEEITLPAPPPAPKPSYIQSYVSAFPETSGIEPTIENYDSQKMYFSTLDTSGFDLPDSFSFPENTVTQSNEITDEIIKNNGEALWYPTDYTPVSIGCGAVVLEKDGKQGAYTLDEYWILQPKYDSISQFTEGLAVVSENGKYGLYDTGGNCVIEPIFDKISLPTGGRIAAYSDDTGFVVFQKCIKAE